MTDREPEKTGGGDPLILRIVLALLYPLFWCLDKLKK